VLAGGGAVQDPWIVGVDARAIAVGNGYVYWSDGGGIGRATVAGADVDPAYVPVPGGAEQIALNGQAVFWTALPSDTIGVAFFDSGTLEVSSSFISLRHAPSGIAVDGYHVYWSEPDADAIGQAVLPNIADYTVSHGVKEGFLTGLDDPVAVTSAGSSTPIASGMWVNCPSTAVVGSSIECEAEVGSSLPLWDAEAMSRPSGPVSFASSGAGGFSAPTCALHDVGPGSVCQIGYTPEAVGTGVQTLTATYGGDGTYGAATASAQLQANAGPLLVLAPSASVSAATVTGPRTATLHGTVGPAGQDTQYWFEYGTTNSYGQRAPAANADTGAGSAPVAVSAAVTGLSPAMTYHYRLDVTSAGGTTESADQTFTTPAACRDWLGPLSRFDRSASRVTAAGFAVIGHTKDHGGCQTHVVDPRDRGGVARVRIAVQLITGARCRSLRRDRRFGQPSSCTRPAFVFIAQGTKSWTWRRTVALAPGTYRLLARGTDLRGNLETPRSSATHAVVMTLR